MTQNTRTRKKDKKDQCKSHGKQVKQVELAIGNFHLGDLTTTVVPQGCAELKFYFCFSHGSTAPGAEVKFYFRVSRGSNAPEER